MQQKNDRTAFILLIGLFERLDAQTIMHWNAQFAAQNWQIIWQYPPTQQTQFAQIQPTIQGLCFDFNQASQADALLQACQTQFGLPNAVVQNVYFPSATTSNASLEDVMHSHLFTPIALTQCFFQHTQTQTHDDHEKNQRSSTQMLCYSPEYSEMTDLAYDLAYTALKKSTRHLAKMYAPNLRVNHLIFDQRTGFTSLALLEAILFFVTQRASTGSSLIVNRQIAHLY